MSELEESSALVGDYLRGITQPDALAESFRQMAGDSPIDSRKAAVKFSTSSRCPPNLDFAPFLQRVTE
jgi:hypothetical protein